VRASRTVLRETQGEIPWVYSPKVKMLPCMLKLKSPSPKGRPALELRLFGRYMLKTGLRRYRNSFAWRSSQN